MLHFLLRRWRPTVFLIVVVILECSLGCASEILLHPSHDPRDTQGAVSRMIPFGDHQQLEIWVKRTAACQGREPLAYVLHFNGNKSRADDDTPAVAELWDRWPVEVWGMNYPGYGRSTGRSNLSDIPPADLAAYDALRQVAGTKPIFLSSNSIGGCSAIYLAGQRDVAGMVIQDPPPLRRLIIEHYGWWNLWILSSLVALDVPANMNTPTTGPLAHAPACFLMADEDTVIPPFYHQVVVDAYGGKSTVINMPGNTHDSPIAGEPKEKCRQWIDQRWHELFPETQPSK